MNRAVTSIMSFQFLAFCFGTEIGTGVLVSYWLLTMIGTIGSPGLPGSMRYTTMPFYVAAGIPLSAYMFSKAIDDIPDIFKTILNVTYPVVLLGLVMRLRTGIDRYILRT
jgi:Na+/H+-dicarboxylate symporter